jgi:hypothetical protein
MWAQANGLIGEEPEQSTMEDLEQPNHKEQTAGREAGESKRKESEGSKLKEQSVGRESEESSEDLWTCARAAGSRSWEELVDLLAEVHHYAASSSLKTKLPVSWSCQ